MQSRGRLAESASAAPKPYTPTARRIYTDVCDLAHAVASKGTPRVKRRAVALWQAAPWDEVGLRRVQRELLALADRRPRRAPRVRARSSLTGGRPRAAALAASRGGDSGDDDPAEPAQHDRVDRLGAGRRLSERGRR